MQSLLDVVKQDPETPELHFALGALYRRRGETERAIRVHQNLLQRRDLSAENQATARYELGLDYVKAGLLDQAESALAPLEETKLAPLAEEQRLIIAQSTRDWRLADEIATLLKKNGHEQATKHHVHYPASSAEEALQSQTPSGQLEAIKQYLRRAAEIDSNHPRVGALELRLQEFDGTPLDERLTNFENYGKRFPAQFALVAKPYLELLDNVSTDQKASGSKNSLDRGLDTLKTAFVSEPNPDLLLLALQFAQKIKDQGEPLTRADLPVWIRNGLLEVPSTRTLTAWLQWSARLESTSTLAENEVIDPDTNGVVQPILDRLNAKVGRYRCKSCGFQARQHYWNCPGCNQWETYSPFTER